MKTQELEVKHDMIDFRNKKKTPIGDKIHNHHKHERR